MIISTLSLHHMLHILLFNCTKGLCEWQEGAMDHLLQTHYSMSVDRNSQTVYHTVRRFLFSHFVNMLHMSTDHWQCIEDIQQQSGKSPSLTTLCESHTGFCMLFGSNVPHE